MMTEMDDPMVLEHGLATRAREKLEAVSKTCVLENSVVDSPASGAMVFTGQVAGMETMPPAVTHSPVVDDMSKHGDGALSEAAQEEDLALSMKPSEGVRVLDLPFESSSFLSPNSGNFNDNEVEGTVVAQKKCRIRGKSWGRKDTDDLLEAVLNTPKVSTRMEQGTDSDSYWDAVGKAVPGRTGLQCSRRMDTLKKAFSKMEKYSEKQGKEFKQLSEKDFREMKVSPRLTEAWYNQIRDHCPPRPKKKLKTNGAGSSSMSTGFASGSANLGLQPPDLPDGIDQGEPTLVLYFAVVARIYGVGIQQREFVCTPCQGRSHSYDCNLKSYPVVRLSPHKVDIGIKSDRELHYIKLCHALSLTSEELGLVVVEILHFPRAEWPADLDRRFYLGNLKIGAQRLMGVHRIRSGVTRMSLGAKEIPTSEGRTCEGASK